MAVAQWVKTLTFYEILVGMKATITVFIQRIILRNRKAITLQYPHDKRARPGTDRGMCVQACPVDALAMTTEYEWAKYNKRDLRLNKEQLLALGDRNFPVREKKLEFQHPNVAYFNIGHKNLPPKES